MEKAVLGALLFSESPERVKQVREDLPADAFMAQAREVYVCLCEMAERGDSINPLMLWTRLKERNSMVDGATVAMLTDDAPIRSDLSTEIAELKKLATLRAVQYYANYLLVESQAKDADVASLVDRIKTRASELQVEAGGQKQAISYSWADLCEMKFPPRETLLHETERGEVVMCAAITNRGKTTLWRNVALSLAIGRPFEPLVKQGPPRVVYYLDFETRLPRVRADITNMLGSLEVHERALVAQNFHLVADCRIDGLPLSFSNPKHLAIIEADARRVGADVLVVDTLTAAFDIENENDNALGTRIMKQLINLAQRLNAVVVHLHHIGKAKQEEGQTATNVHRARGGSAYSGNSTAIFNILPDPQRREIITLECAKVKGEHFLDTVFQLERETRWFGFQAVPVSAPAAPTIADRLLGIFNGQPLKRTKILELLSDLSETTIDRELKAATETGDLTKIKIGRETAFLRDKKQQSSQSSFPIERDDCDDCPQIVDVFEDKSRHGVSEKNGHDDCHDDCHDDEFNDRYLDAIDQ
jgi:replicative DNA helicase